MENVPHACRPRVEASTFLHPTLFIPNIMFFCLQVNLFLHQYIMLSKSIRSQNLQIVTIFFTQTSVFEVFLGSEPKMQRYVLLSR
jgi:hypothetical protein